MLADGIVRDAETPPGLAVAEEIHQIIKKVVLGPIDFGLLDGLRNPPTLTGAAAGRGAVDWLVAIDTMATLSFTHRAWVDQTALDTFQHRTLTRRFT